MKNLYVKKGDFLLVYFRAKRNLLFNIPTTITKIDFKQNYSLDEQITPNFLQYIVNMKAERSFAKDDGDTETVTKIDAWFLQFEKVLREIFDDSSLVLEFERKTFNFNIRTKDHELFDFNTLSEGYAALLNIVMELMLRMDAKNRKAYDAQGLVLIDEIETHLHLDLQKKVLPFLIAIFPKIQFVVTTHSPFVLSSVEKAVVFDLEKKVRVANLSDYSFEAIVETYFGIDQYSKVLTRKITEYELLLQKDSFSDAEADRCDTLRYELRNAPKFLAPELEYKILELENLRRLKLKKV
jgi:AAA15 family ATPase/GTPase